MDLALILKLFPFIMNVLKGLGVVKDPEEEKAYRIKLLELASQKDLAASTEFVEFLKATAPASADTPRWINGLQAATRPLLTWVSMGTIVASIWIPGLAERASATLEAFGKAGTFGLLFLVPPIWWFIGRSVEKLSPLAGLFVKNGNGNGHDINDVASGAARTATRPVVRPTQPVPTDQPEGSPLQ